MQQYCQSCGIVLSRDVLGTESNGSLSHDYCGECYDSGGFRKPKMTMSQMIEHWIPIMNMHGFDENDARQLLESRLPGLQRWKVIENDIRDLALRIDPLNLRNVPRMSQDEFRIRLLAKIGEQESVHCHNDLNTALKDTVSIRPGRRQPADNDHFRTENSFTSVYPDAFREDISDAPYESNMYYQVFEDEWSIRSLLSRKGSQMVKAGSMMIAALVLVVLPMFFAMALVGSLSDVYVTPAQEAGSPVVFNETTGYEGDSQGGMQSAANGGQSQAPDTYIVGSAAPAANPVR